MKPGTVDRPCNAGLHPRLNSGHPLARTALLPSNWRGVFTRPSGAVLDDLNGVPLEAPPSMQAASSAPNALDVVAALTSAISLAADLDHIYTAALDGLHHGLGVERASILLFDADGVMHFKAWR